MREQQPDKRLPDGSYLLTRYADVLQVYKQPQLFSSDNSVNSAPSTVNHRFTNTTPPAWFLMIHPCIPVCGA
ncbi:MAG: hypothetical protein R3E89_11450 [Thiolinea sp.]